MKICRGLLLNSKAVVLWLLAGLLLPAVAAGDPIHRDFVHATDVPVSVSIGGMIAGKPAWTLYKRQFLDTSGRIVDTGNGGVSHSEGQGYGMLIAVAAGDRPAFEQIWAWTRRELRTRRDRLFAWKWEPGARRAVDSNNASDGDLLIAWALVEAAEFWNEPAWSRSGLDILDDLGAEALRRHARFGSILLPGGRGFSPSDRDDGPVVNLSYWIFPALSRLRETGARRPWAQLLRDGAALLDVARFGRLGLPAEWTSLRGSEPAPARGEGLTFGLNAIRVPLHLYWAGIGNHALFDAVAKGWEDNRGLPRVIDGQSAKRDEFLPERGYQAIAALTRCAASGRAFPEGFYEIAPGQKYYPTTLHVLSIMAALSRGGPCLDAPGVRAVASPTWRPRPAQITPDWRTDDDEAAAHEFLMAPGGPERSAPRTSAEAAPSAAVTPLVRLLFWTGLLAAPFLAAARFFRGVPDRSPAGSTGFDAEFARRVEAAVEVSARFGRKTGLVALRIKPAATGPGHGRGAIAPQLANDIAGALTRRLPPHDFLHADPSGVIFACVAFLDTEEELANVAATLADRARRIAGAGDEEISTGTVICPGHGVPGEDLMRAALSG